MQVVLSLPNTVTTHSMQYLTKFILFSKIFTALNFCQIYQDPAETWTFFLCDCCLFQERSICFNQKASLRLRSYEFLIFVKQKCKACTQQWHHEGGTRDAAGWKSRESWRQEVTGCLVSWVTLITALTTYYTVFCHFCLQKMTQTYTEVK